MKAVLDGGRKFFKDRGPTGGFKGRGFQFSKRFRTFVTSSFRIFTALLSLVSSFMEDRISYAVKKTFILSRFSFEIPASASVFVSLQPSFQVENSNIVGKILLVSYSSRQSLKQVIQCSSFVLQLELLS